MKTCPENWKSIPYTSDHIWPCDVHNNPIGCCLKCGKHIDDWNNEMIGKAIKHKPTKEKIDKFIEYIKQ